MSMSRRRDRPVEGFIANGRQQREMVLIHLEKGLDVGRVREGKRSGRGHRRRER